MRRHLAILFATAIVMFAAGVAADPLAPVVIEQRGRGRVRVQVAEGLTRPCDSLDNRMLLDGWLSEGEVRRGAIAGDCICVRHTSASFPRADWSQPGLACRPRVCRGKVCRPAADSTIRVTIGPS